MSYNYLIVEDNPGCVKNLQTALKSHKDFSAVGAAPTLSKGIAMALSTKPHLIFLDVELGDENGFDLIKEVRQHTSDFPFIIMMTDYERYAKKAVNTDVLYFLDKPIDPDELAIGLRKFEKQFSELQDHITIKTSDGHFFIPVDSIQYLQSDSNYCKIHRDIESMIVTKTLKNMERVLPNNFIRIHKSYIVNTKYVQMLNTTKKIIRLNIYNPDDETYLELPVGGSYLSRVRHHLLTTRPK